MLGKTSVTRLRKGVEERRETICMSNQIKSLFLKGGEDNGKEIKVVYRGCGSGDYDCI
jgi:hypothetical protein